MHLVTVPSSSGNPDLLQLTCSFISAENIGLVIDRHKISQLFFFQSKEKNMHVCTQLIEEGHSMYRSSLATPQDVVIYSWILSCIVLYYLRPKLLVILIFLNS